MPTPICRLCYRPIAVQSLATLIDGTLTVCDRCFGSFCPRFHEFEVDGTAGLAVYEYDSWIKEQLYRFKGCGDYELKDMFLERFRFYLRWRYRGYQIVLIPSWHQDDEMRGFNHVEALFEGLGLPMHKVLFKKRAHKQAELSYEARQRVNDVFGIVNATTLKGRKILLVDDVMTTGASLKAGLRLLKECAPKTVKVLVMSRTSSRK